MTEQSPIITAEALDALCDLNRQILIAQIDGLDRREEEAVRVVAEALLTLPTLADGAVAFPGMTLHHPVAAGLLGYSIFELKRCVWHSPRTINGEPGATIMHNDPATADIRRRSGFFAWLPWSQLYSTREAAEAALAARKK